MSSTNGKFWDARLMLLLATLGVTTWCGAYSIETRQWVAAAIWLPLAGWYFYAVVYHQGGTAK